ncbi:hypothetical protein [Mesorhizobium sp. M0590]|uniref:hypothetical protein n=1 Tax=Mesorhizobium sp. M0590 TaxID=2956966 RepID=UPI003334F6EC
MAAVAVLLFHEPRQAPAVIRRDGRRGLQVAVDRFVSGRLRPIVMSRVGDAIEDDAQDALVGDVDRCRRICVFISTTGAAILMRRNRDVSYWAMAKLERFDIDPKKARPGPS